MSKYVLIAPAVDFYLSNTLAHVGAGAKNANFSQGSRFKKGARLFDTTAQNLSDRSLLSTLFGIQARIDLSVKTPVEGLYYSRFCNTGFYGSSEGDSYSYTPEKVEKRSSLPTSLEELRNTAKPAGFCALIDESTNLMGISPYYNYFDQLRANREKITKWIIARDINYIDTDAFWEAVECEAQRLSNIICPVIPYDGRPLG